MAIALSGPQLRANPEKVRSGFPTGIAPTKAMKFCAIDYSPGHAPEPRNRRHEPDIFLRVDCGNALHAILSRDHS
ncbi:MAG: hypothetical protein EOR72_11000 [Mesorhizobium sp.]|uniref:hypothetical protein n=1 Tax=Mesorhizobium sp. TaxID=1871066 RepID=UPI000FEA33DF|nr:hypothetical protein [Mesorhizobium sp.]RWM16242.1 MAG: hypothetical protein EOR72_11000 [Mesorhizobium sp.]